MTEHSPPTTDDFVCIHGVLLKNGSFLARVLHRGDRQTCESVADLGVDDDLNGLGDVERDAIMVRPASVWDEVEPAFAPTAESGHVQ